MWKFIGREPQPSKSNYTFKMQHSFDKRLRESQRIKQKFPNKVPIIVEKSDRSFLPDIKRPKYIIQQDLTVSQFIHILRKNIQLTPNQAIFLFVNNSIIPSGSDKLEDLYSKHGDKDGFLYVTYTSENTFG